LTLKTPALDSVLQSSILSTLLRELPISRVINNIVKITSVMNGFIKNEEKSLSTSQNGVKWEVSQDTEFKFKLKLQLISVEFDISMLLS